MSQFLKIGQVLTLNKLSDKYLEVKIVRSKEKEKESLYFLIEIVNDQEGVSEIGKKIIEVVSHGFFNENQSESLENRFEKALKKSNLQLAEIAQNGINSWVGKTNSIIAAISHDNIVVTSTGNSKAYLFRNGNFSQIIESSEEKLPPIKTFSSLITGTIKQSDKLLLATQSLFDNLPFYNIKQIVNDYDPVSAVNELGNALVHQKVKDVNLILIEYVPKDKANFAPPEDKLPVFYLDKKQPNAFDKLAKKLSSFNNAVKTKDYSSTKKNISNISTVCRKIIIGLGYYIIWIGRQFKIGSKEFKETKRNVLKENLRKKAKYKEWENFIERPQKSSGFKLFLKSFIVFFGNLFLSLFKPKNRKKLIGLLILITIIVIFFVAKALSEDNPSAKQAKQNDELVTSIESRLSEAKLNIQLGKKDLAKTSLEHVLKDIEKITEEDKKNELKKIAQNSLDLILGILRVVGSTPISEDADLISKKTTSLLLENDSLYDIKETGQIFKIDVKNNQLENIGEIEKRFGLVKNASYVDKKVVIITQNNNVLEFDPGQKTIKEAGLEIGSWPQITAQGSYAKRLYLLSQFDNQIYRLVQTPTGWQKPQGIISATADLHQYIDLAIDGDIFLLNESNILKIIFGKIDSEFKVQGINLSEKNPSNIFTNENLNNLYVLTDQGSLIQLTKAGQYQREIVIDQEIITGVVFIDDTNLYVSTDKGLKKVTI